MQGFSQNRDQPIPIEAASLRCATEKEATSPVREGVQGDTTGTSKTLVVFYDSPRPRPRAGGQCEDRGKICSNPSATTTPVPGGSSFRTQVGANG